MASFLNIMSLYVFWSLDKASVAVIRSQLHRLANSFTAPLYKQLHNDSRTE